jgi:hypothetical protein
MNEAQRTQYIKKTRRTLEDHSILTLAESHLRYEALRKIKPSEYTNLWVNASRTDSQGCTISFDDLVDKLVLEETP